MKRSAFAYPYLFYAMIFFLAPLLLIVYYSFTTHTAMHTVFTIEHFKRFFDFKNPQYMVVLLKSFKISFISTAACLIIGYPMAFILSRLKPGVRGILSMLFILPMWMNFLLRTYAWATLLEKNGIINMVLTAIGLAPINIMYTDTAVIIGLIYNFLPFMILPIYNMLTKIDGSLVEAAEDLGASPWRTFWKVTFRLTLPGVMSGINMVFMPAVTTFVISQLLGGNNSILIGDVIEKQFKVADDWGFGSAMSVIIMALVLLFMALFSGFDKQGEEDGMVL
ncbi:MAG: ABC transporter permease [Bacillota bacterium]|nr:ABC transporter permease [Bacillota bacterium]